MRTYVQLVLWAFFCGLIVTSLGQGRFTNLQYLGGLDPEVLEALASTEAQYPDKPDVFKTPGDLRRYLDALNSFYAITGRPRFGKRNVKKRKMNRDEDYAASRSYTF